MKKTKLQWHPAFGAALRITLQDELQYLEMREEYLLSKKPLQMDILIIKKLKDVPIRKTIGRIFRKHNIIEYKSPGDSLSINDFYKVYGYACIYQSNTEYQGVWIYYLKGDPIPMQLLIVPKLTDTENYWLQSMRTDLQAGKEIQKLMREYEKHRKSKDYAAVMDLITRANWEQMEVEIKMIREATGLSEEEIEKIRREIE